jgi:hypothetical protein
MEAAGLLLLLEGTFILDLRVNFATAAAPMASSQCN